MSAIEEGIAACLASAVNRLSNDVNKKVPAPQCYFSMFIIDGAICAWSEVVLQQNTWFSEYFFNSILSFILFLPFTFSEYFFNSIFDLPEVELIDKDILDRSIATITAAHNAMKRALLCASPSDNPFTIFLCEFYRMLHITPSKELDSRVLKSLYEFSENYKRRF